MLVTSYRFLVNNVMQEKVSNSYSNFLAFTEHIIKLKVLNNTLVSFASIIIFFQVFFRTKLTMS